MTKQIKTKSKFLIIFTFVLTFLITITLADLCSNIITIKAFSSSSAFRGQSSYAIYAISLFSSQSKASALTEASNQQKQSGAGFVWQQNNNFYVIASAYGAENDATLVSENLKKENLNPEIIKITIPQITITGTTSQNEINALTSAICIYKLVFDNLYDISVALDTKVSTQAESLLFIADVENLATKAKLNFEALYSASTENETLLIKLSLNSLCKKLEALKNHPNNTSSTQTFSSKIKSTYMETIEINYELSLKTNEI